MAIKQLSAFVENKPGKLSHMIKALSEADINLRAMSIADTKDFGILRLIVSDIEKATAVLSEESLVTATDVIAVEMHDKAGELYKILDVLNNAAINIEYMYAFTAASDRGAYVVFRVDNNEDAEDILNKNGFTTLDQSDMAAL